MLQAEKEREKAEKRRAEGEKEYDVAQNKLEEYVAANPGDATSDRYKMLEEAKETVKGRYKAELTWENQANANLTETLEKTRVATQEVCRVMHV